MMVHPGQQGDRQRVIPRLEDDEQLSASGGWHEKGIAGWEWVYRCITHRACAELGHRVVGEHDQLHGRPLLAADGTPDACGAAAPTMNIAAALSCTAAAVRQVAGPDTASEGSWERSPGAVSDGPTMDLLALQRRCCCLSPGGPARRWRGSRRPRKTHLNSCHSRLRSLLRTLQNLHPSR